MGWFNRSVTPEQYGQYVATLAFLKPDEDHKYDRIIIQPDNETQQLHVVFLGMGFEKQRAALTTKASRLDPDYKSRLGTPEDRDGRIEGLVPTTVTIGKKYYEEVLKALNDALEAKGKKPYPMPKKKAPGAGAAIPDQKVIPGEKVNSIADFPQDLLDELFFDISADGKDLIVTVIPEVNAKLTLAKSQYLSTNCNMKKTDKGWEFTFKDRALSASLIRTLRDRVGMVQRQEDAIDLDDDAVNAVPTPPWITELKKLKDQDARAFHIQFAAVGKGDQQKTIALIILRDEDARDAVSAVFSGAHIKAHATAVDEKMGEQLKKKNIPVTEQSSMLRLADPEVVDALREAFRAPPGRKKDE